MLHQRLIQNRIRLAGGQLRRASIGLSLAMMAGALLGLGHTPASAQTYPTQIGVEADCRGAGPFVDLVKTIRPWGVIGGSTNAPVDANGWPTTDAEAVLMDDRPVPAWAPPLDDPAAFQPAESGTYNCSFTGQATLAVNGGSVITIANQVYNSSTNTTTFTFNLPSGTWQTAPNLVVIDFSNTKLTATSATNTGFTNFKAIRPGYPANTTQVFTDPFVNAFPPFDHVRFMGWKDTNYTAGYYGDAGHHLINWSDRGLPSDASQSTNQAFRAGAIGISWEYIILLANQINKDVWINIPISATGYNTTDTTSYIYQLALLFKNGDAATGNVGLKPGLHIYIEHSNEVWNFGFSQYTWNKLEAVDAVAGTGSLGTTKVNSDGSTDQEVWAHRRHAERLYQIAQIFKTVFGTGSLNTTIRPVYASWVINGQSYYTDVLNWMNSQYGAPSGYFYAMAGTSYFGETPTAGESVATILANMQGGSDGSLTYTKQLRTIATNFGLKLFAYEAGPDNGGGSTTNVGNRILANRDPGMTTLIEHDVRTNYFGQGLADSYNYFTMSSGFSRYGCWGASDDITQTGTNMVKWAAIYNLTGYTPGSPPAAPTGLTATPASTQVTLNWTASSGATSYKIYRATASGGEGTTPITSGISTTSYSDTGLTNGTTYFYKVAGVNVNGTGAQSGEASATPNASAPPVPTGLTATAGNAQVALSWTASSGATAYDVKRSTVSGSGYATVSSPTVTNYTNTGLTNGTTYYFVVDAKNASGTSANSSQVSATPNAAAPQAQIATATTAPVIDGNVDSVWSAATSYNITHVSGTISSGADLSASWQGLWDATNLYVLATVTDDVKVNDSTNPWDDDSVEIYLDADHNGGTVYDANDRQIVCGWGDAAPVEGAGRAISGAAFGKADPTGTTYRIEAKIPWAIEAFTPAVNAIIGVDVHVNDDDDGGARDGKLMWNDATDGAWGNPSLFGTGKLLPIPAPPAPTNLTATPGNGQVVLNWTASAGATSYTVNFTTGGNYTVAGNPTTTTFTHTGLTNGTLYTYFVTATNAGGTSGSSNNASATPTSGAPAAPTGLAATPGNTQVALTWNASTGATAYDVKRSTVSGSGYATVSSPTTTSYTNTGLTNGTTYYFVVDAKNASGTSANSAQVGATPSAGGGTGLKGEYYNSQDFSGPIALTRTDATVDFDWASGSPGTGVNATSFSVRWSGQVLAPGTGNYTFSTTSDDGVRLWVNGVLVINDWTLHGTTVDNSPLVALTAGTKYDIHMEYFQNTGGDVAKLHWNYPGQADQAIPTSQLFTVEQIATVATATTAPTIDGTVDAAWGNAPTYSEVNPTGTLPGGATLAAVWQAMWDSTNLYVLVTVTDSTLIANTDPTLGDSAEVYIDGDNNKATAYDTNDWQYVFPWNSTNLEEWSGGHQGSNTTGIVWAQTNITGGYRIEGKIPWTTIGVTAAANNLVGLDFAINNSNVSGTKNCKVFWNATTDNDWSSPNLFGTARLK